jgi:hypothetical protein
VKKTYPNLMSKASVDLRDPLVQVTNIIVGYNITLKVVMDKDTYTKVTNLIDTAKKWDESATATLFGMRLNVGGSGSFEEQACTNYSLVQQGPESCSITNPAAGDARPVVLAIVGTVMT